MIKQTFDVEHYWRVIVLYDADYNFLRNIIELLHDNGFTKDFTREVLTIMYLGLAKAVTCSNTEDNISIVIFNPHESMQDYMDSIVHEAEHIKQAMLYKYNVEDRGEPPAYTVGYLVSRMYEVFSTFICSRKAPL